MRVLRIEDLDIEVRGSSQRRTLQLTVDRGGEVVLFAPADCEPRLIEKFVRSKQFWIYRKLVEKERLRPTTATKEYVSGEGFPYLGRSYRLLLVDEQSQPVRLEDGLFKMLRGAAPNGREHMVAWYLVHAQPWIEERVVRLSARVGTAPCRVVVRDLGYRWGSCGKDGTIYFHWRSILLPPRVVEYIVAHELVHMGEPNHSAEFWLRVERAMPDFITRKEWLAENGNLVAAL
jgi:predicted metal-dependent hydrolase